MIRYEVRGNVATITLDDPRTRNALGREMIAEITDGLEVARADNKVRCVVLTSSHERVFSAGADLAAFAAEAPLLRKHVENEELPRLFRLIGELGKPTLCAANGHVLAAALGLALACDLIVAEQSATFGTPEINVGVFPFMIMALIYRNVPRKRANELLLLGGRISSEQACDLGLVNRVVSGDEFETTVTEWAEQLASKSPLMMRLGKDAIWRQMDLPIVAAFEYLRQSLALALSSEDLQEGVTAFFEKREPKWKGR